MRFETMPPRPKAEAWPNIRSPPAPVAVALWFGVSLPAVFAPPTPGWCPRRRTSPPAPMVTPSTTTFPTVLPSLPAAVPAALLGIGHLAVSQGLGSSVDRRSVNCGYGEHDEGRRTKCRESVAHCSNSSRPHAPGYPRQEYLLGSTKNRLWRGTPDRLDQLRPDLPPVCGSRPLTSIDASPPAIPAKVTAPTRPVASDSVPQGARSRRQSRGAVIVHVGNYRLIQP